MSPTPHRIVVEPEGFEVWARDGETVMGAATRAGYRWPTVCRGEATCTTCYVLVRHGRQCLDPVGPLEASALLPLLERHAGEEVGAVRLACQAVVRGDITVHKRGVRLVGVLSGTRSR
jgi:ferredoxin